MSCLWVITVPEGKRIKLSFQYFDVQWSLNCNKDYVKVYDGLHPASILKKTLCGSSFKLRDEISSSGRYLVVQFRSDGDNDDSYGFKAHFEEVNPSKCNPLFSFVYTERFSTKCRKTKTKLKVNRQSNDPIKTRS